MPAGPWALLTLFMFAGTGTIVGAPVSAARQLKDIEYSRVDGVSLLLNASLPSSSVPAPAVIIVHGGGWVRGDRVVDVQPLFRPLAEAGFAWFSIDYRLATDITQFGVAIDDVETALRFVKEHAAEYNIDPRRVGLIGESAGGQLAAMAALRAGPDSSVKAVVALYTPTDLVSLFKNAAFIPAQIRDRVQGTPFEAFVLAGLSQLSPVENVRRDMPPFLFVHGTADSLVPFTQSTQMCACMKQAGASCEVYPVEGAGHGIRWWETSSRVDGGYKCKIVQWLEQELGRPQTSVSGAKACESEVTSSY